MIHHFPKLKYNGLTIILSNPSRFDKNTFNSATPKLITGVAEYFFTNECLSPETNRYCCDIRLIDNKEPLLPDTKCILLLGQRALTLYSGNTTITLNEQRGSPIMVDNIPCIASYLPQDAIDPQNYEDRFNEDALFTKDEISDEFNADEFLEAKGRGKTARSNYRFWLKADVKKALHICKSGIPIPSFEPEYIIYPSIDIVCDVLSKTKNQDFYIDIETDFYSLDMRCFAFNFSEDNRIFIVPTLDVDYKPAYDELYKIIAALVIAMRDNCTIAHNGAIFDFFVFAYKYHLPIGRNVYDTLVAQHRIYPDIEKSLGHCISYWTYLPYHKDEGHHGYRNTQEAEKLWLYCGKDVYSMRLVKEAQIQFASQDKGLLHSINTANASIRPYLINTLLGMYFDDNIRRELIVENDKLMSQYLRCMRILCGPSIEPLISNKKCVEYFHNQLKYPPIKRTPTGGISLAADALLKLRLKHENPVISFLLKYRQKQKETGTLNFKTWITN